MTTIFKPYYTGGGEITRNELPLIKPDTLTEPSGYIAPPDLVSAVNVALELGVPLLLTGEPGCGKSQLAYSLAWELGLSEPFEFTVKSDTQSRDLFYSFDTLGRFRAARSNQETDSDDAHRFLRMDALGLAIFHALGKTRVLEIDSGFEKYLDNLPTQPQRSVVLIDEIDKAPREVPNDILNEIDRMSFDIPEIIKENNSKVSFSLKQKKNGPEQDAAQDDPLPRPIVVITSNRERELPEAFLRRCVYFHVELPPFRSQLKDSKRGGDSSDSSDGQEVTIERIVKRRLKLDHEIPAERNKPNAAKSILSGGISFFEYLSGDDVQLLKKPSTAELLNWMLLLRNRCDAADTVKDKQSLFFTSAKVTLFKHQEDQDEAENIFNEWLELEPEA